MSKNFLKLMSKNFLKLMSNSLGNKIISYYKPALGKLKKYKFIFLFFSIISILIGFFSIKFRDKEWQSKVEILIDSSYPLSLRSSLNNERQILKNPYFYKEIFNFYKKEMNLLEKDLQFKNYKELMANVSISQRYEDYDSEDSNYLIVKFSNKDKEVTLPIIKLILNNYKEVSNLNRLKAIEYTNNFLISSISIQETKLSKIRDSFNKFLIEKDIEKDEVNNKDNKIFKEYSQFLKKGGKDTKFILLFYDTYYAEPNEINFAELFKMKKDLTRFYNEKYHQINKNEVSQYEKDLQDSVFELSKISDFQENMKSTWKTKRMLEKLKVKLDFLELKSFDQPIWVYISEPDTYQINKPNKIKIYTLSLLGGFISSAVIIIVSKEIKILFKSFK